MSRSVRSVGPGRAGTAFPGALAAAGWTVLGLLGRGDAEAIAGAASGTDLVLVATPDGAVAEVARAIRPDPGAVVAHVAGSLGLDVLAPHVRRGALHPLMPLPDGELGAQRLRSAWFAVAGDLLVIEAVDALGGRWFEVADEARAGYHAAACIASNHLVALLGQAERVAAGSGVPLEAYLDLVDATVGNVRALGPAAALTGPAARGDWETIERHRAVLAALGADELAAYDAMVAMARRLVERPSE
jgi:predicted short-subunit dehydrogenase-like oxidoreductase (DUF2520 family)